MALITQVLKFKDRFDVINPVDEVKRLNDTVAGDDQKTWDYSSNLIARKYIKNAEGFIFDFAECFDDLVGYVVVRQDYKDSTEAYLAFLVVHGDFHHTGIGTQLLKRAIDKVKIASFKSLSFKCEEKDVSFYENFAKKNTVQYTSKSDSRFRNGAQSFLFTYTLV